LKILKNIGTYFAYAINVINDVNGPKMFPNRSFIGEKVRAAKYRGRLCTLARSR
jgi:hypothetical protein